MNLVERLETRASPEELFGLVSDLGTYPDWLGLVVRADAEPVPDGDEEPSWLVELRGRIGPLARSKRLRMVRTACDGSGHVRFERVEIDGRNHADWTLDVIVEPCETGAALTMTLHYGGNRFAPVLTPILRDEIRRGRQRLQSRFDV